ncbi:cysteine synthase family protein [Sorangium cellulosum]|uniref:cysteine synthase family protein n=1 Tax=Sorangium cellulosum TaxID=56 RepID=UPI003D9A5097
MYSERHLPPTELYPLRRVCDAGDAAVFAKCEFKNPTGSHKDRIFAYIIHELERQALIEPGMTLVECSTGNGGAALAYAGRERGYKVVVFMPAGMTIERKTQMRSFGAEIIETHSESFLTYAEEQAREYVRKHPGSYFIDQSTSPLNRQAWRRCGAEIVSAFRARDTVVDLFICAIGTGGTFSGIAEELKASFPAMRTVAIEVDRSAPLHARRHGAPFQQRSHNLMGLGPGKLTSVLREDLVDDVEVVSGEEGWTMMKSLIDQEGLFVGPTAGGNVAIALRHARRLGPGKNIVTVLFDSAWKYFSVWDGNYGCVGGPP